MARSFIFNKHDPFFSMRNMPGKRGAATVDVTEGSGIVDPTTRGAATVDVTEGNYVNECTKNFMTQEAAAASQSVIQTTTTNNNDKVV
jgi:hypothetical protein